MWLVCYKDLPGKRVARRQRASAGGPSVSPTAKRPRITVQVKLCPACITRCRAYSTSHGRLVAASTWTWCATMAAMCLIANHICLSKSAARRDVWLLHLSC